MVVSVRGYNGVEYLEHCKTPVNVVATVTHNGKKLKMKGPAAIVEMRKSWKYGHELHVTLHCDPLQVIEKTPNRTPWTRVEIAIPFNLGLQWLQRGLDSVYEGSGKKVSGDAPEKLHEWL